jgi:hypothetical protein
VGRTQTPPPVGHTHTLTAEGNNKIDVSGDTAGTRRRHYHTLTDAIDGSTEEASHSHDGDISMEPDQVVTSSPSTGSTGVGPVIQPVDGYYSYGNWVYGGTGSPPADTSTMEYRVLTSATDGEWGPPYGEWSDEITGVPPNEDGWDYWILSGVNGYWGEPYGEWEYVGMMNQWNQMPVNGEYEYRRSIRDNNNDPWPNSSYTAWSEWEEHVTPLAGGGYPYPDTDTTEYHSFRVFFQEVSGKYFLAYYSRTRAFMGYLVEKRRRTWHDPIPGVYWKRTMTWVPGSPATYEQRTKTWHPPIPGSGSVNAVSRVNTSFTSFSVNTGGISLGGDGSHSHTISIPTSGSSNENGHTHTVSASGIADINVSGNTISGGAHNHTFNFMYNELKDISNQNTRIASETTVKNRKMRIWRRTA